MDKFLIDSALKAQQWERAKGELRALVALQGSYSTGEESEQTERWLELRKQVEEFILNVEDNALHE